MPIIDTATLREGEVHQFNEQIYNGLDVCVTHEVFQEIRSIAPNQNVIYDFERALQGPVMDMMQRGFLIDQYERHKGIEFLEAELLRLQIMLNRFANAVWHRPLNANSPKQLIDFFFGAMRIPEIWSSKKGERKLSVDREALEKLDNYYYARPLVSTILAIRDVTKQLSVLRTEVDPDGRMRTSYNIAGTETGRFSSSANAYGTGTNLQNITAALRKMFLADPGWKLCGIDLEQAESREVGWLSGVICGDWSYLDACYSGDLHTLVARTAWPGLAWTGDPKADRAIADTPFYRHLTYRDMSKKLGHGCLTNDHEVLTRNGWVPITDKPREILAWNDSYSDFEQVSNWTDFPFSGTLHSFEGNSISAEMTPDHRVPFKSLVEGIVQERKAFEGPGALMPLGHGQWELGRFVEHTTRQVSSERVLCPTVPSSFFYVRRNGKIFVTGNSNYRGLPPTMAKHAKIPVAVAEQFQHAYFSRFPGIPMWHRHVAKELQTSRHITTVFGRERGFFGRPNDDSTLREAIAFGPQGATGDRLNLILLRIWRAMPEIRLIAQVHDALYFLYPETADEPAIIAQALSYFDIPITHPSGHSLVVPGEAKVGWNWGNYDPQSNPDGLKKWKGTPDDRSRTPLLSRAL